MKANQTFLIFALMVLSICLRWIPNFPNFSPYLAVALFGGALLPNKRNSILGVTAILYLSDLVINNTVAREYFTDYQGFVWFAPYMLVNLIATVAIVLLGSIFLRKPSFLNVAAGSVSAAVIFFLISNFGVWLSGEVTYSRDFSGLMTCYAAAIPFFRGTLMSTVLFSAALFGIHSFIVNYLPKERVIA
jgi:hypothetical protein